MTDHTPTSAPVADALDRLRGATRALHRKLDAGLPLARAGADRGDYLQHLRILQPWLAGLGPLLAHVGWGGEYAALAARDLARAGEPAPPVLALTLPGGAQTAGFAWGVAYVVEGSQLGGQVLYRRLRPALTPMPLDYLRGRGEAAGAHWRAFVQALDAALAAPDAADAACDGAIWAFATLIDCYRHQGLMT